MCGRFSCWPLVKPAPPHRSAAAATPLAPRQQPAPALALAATLQGTLQQLSWQLDAMSLAAGLPAISVLAAQLAGRILTVASIKAIQWVELDPVDLFLLFAPNSFYQL